MTAVFFFLACATAGAWPWSWDFFHQPSHRAQEEPAPPKPDGSVSTKGKPFYAADRPEAASLKNPFSPTLESVKRGKEFYDIYCATCHGEEGHGDGPVGKKYVPPTDLTTDYVQDKPDGDIFYTITHGGLAIMPSYGDSVPKTERWNIINYIKHGLIKEK
ncbi:MAG: c-type cytochrome [Thermodesulfobacteriota bacterium]